MRPLYSLSLRESSRLLGLSRAGRGCSQRRPAAAALSAVLLASVLSLVVAAGPASAATVSATWNNGALTCGTANNATVPLGTTSMTATLLGGGAGGGGAGGTGSGGSYGGNGAPGGQVSVTTYPVTSGTIYANIGCGGGGGASGNSATAGTAGSGFTPGGNGGSGSANGGAGGGGGGSTALCIGSASSCNSLVAIAAGGGGGGAGCANNGAGCGNAAGGGGGAGGSTGVGTGGSNHGGSGTSGSNGAAGSATSANEANSSDSDSGPGFGGSGGGSGVRQGSAPGGAGGGGGGGLGGTGATNGGGTAGSGGANNAPGGGGATGTGTAGSGGTGSGSNASGAGGVGGTTTAGSGNAENMGGGGGGAGWTGGGGGGPDYQQTNGDQFSAGGGAGGSSWGSSGGSPSFSADPNSGVVSSCGAASTSSSSGTGTGQGGYGTGVATSGSGNINGASGTGDAGCPGALTVSFTGNAPATPTQTAGSLTFTTGVSGSATITSTTGVSYAESGTLPGGVTFNTGTGMLSGSASSGGTFPFTVTATNAYGTSSAGSFTLTVNAAAPSKMKFTLEPPSTGTAGTALTAFKVSVQDASGNTITSGTGSGDTVALTIATGPGTFDASSTLSVAAANGVATFNNVVLDTVGSYTLTATDSTRTLSADTSTPATVVSPSAATTLVFSTEPPAAGVAGTALTTFRASVQDAHGNTITSGTGSGDTIAVTVASGPGTFDASSTLNVIAVNGVATFNNVVLDTAGSYTLKATDSTRSLTTATSTPATVLSPGTALQLAFTTQPVANGNIQAIGSGTFPVTVAVEDAHGNVETSLNSGSVTLAIGTNPSSGVLTCSGGLTANVSGGSASFTGCAITKAGSGYTLTATSSPTYLSPTNANPFNITAGSASQLVFGQQPSNAYVGVSMSPAVTVLVEDQNGNLTQSTSSITLTITTNPCGGSPAVTNGTATSLSGTATFSGLQLSKECIGYALTATDSTDGNITAPSRTFAVSVLVTSSADVLHDPATDTGGSGVNSVTYYDCSGFTTSCNSSTPWSTIGSSTTSPNYQVSWTSLPSSGSYSVVAVGVDNAANSTASTPPIPVTVDASGPIGGSISVPSYANTVSVTITKTNFTDSVSGMASNVITRSSGQAPTAGACPTTGYSGATTVTSPDTGVSNGSCYEYTLTGDANDGSSASTSSGPVLVDTTSPSGGAISVPSYANTLSVTITKTNFTDSVSGMASNVITRSSGQAPTAGACPTTGYSGATTVTSPDTGVTNGNCYEYTLTGTDNAGNSASVTSNPVLVDTSPPTGGSIVANNSTSASYDTSATMPLSVTNFTDSGSGMASNSVTRGAGTLSGNVCGVISGSTAVTITSGHDSATLANGCYQYTLTGTNNAGTVATATSAIVKVDTSAPSGGITSPSAGTISGTVSLASTSAADSVSGVASVAYYACNTTCSGSPPGANWTLLGTGTSGSPWSVSWDTTTMANGSYTLKAVISDNAGNTAVTTGIAVTVSNTYSFVVSNPGSPTAGTADPTAITVQLQLNGSNTGTYEGSAYTGSHTIAFSGTAMTTAPNGTAATPASASLSFNSSGQATIAANTFTLYDAQTGASLTATDSANNIAGTSGTFNISAGSAKAFQFTNCSVNSGTPVNPCGSSVNLGSSNNGNVVGNVTVLDSWGNTAKVSGTTLTVGLNLSSTSHFSGSTSVTILVGQSQSSNFTVTHLVTAALTRPRSARQTPASRRTRLR